MIDLKSNFRARIYFEMGEDCGIEITQNFISNQTQDKKFEQVIDDAWDDPKTQVDLRNAHEAGAEEFNKLVNSLYGKFKYKSRQSLK